MDVTPKPSGFGKLEIENKNSDRLNVMKPSPPTHQGGEIKSRKNISKNEIDENLHSFAIIEHPKEGTSPTNFGLKDAFNIVKSLDVNRYATKKTIAQGMLDIALLTANASQLKYILQVGKQHEFYTLMLTLICISIGLQLLQGIICVLLGSTFNINKTQDQSKANIWNNICLAMMVLTVAVNVIISAFEMRSSDLNEKSANFHQKSGIR